MKFPVISSIVVKMTEGVVRKNSRRNNRMFTIIARTHHLAGVTDKFSLKTKKTRINLEFSFIKKSAYKKLNMFVVPIVTGMVILIHVILSCTEGLVFPV